MTELFDLHRRGLLRFDGTAFIVNTNPTNLNNIDKSIIKSFKKYNVCTHSGDIYTFYVNDVLSYEYKSNKHKDMLKAINKSARKYKVWNKIQVKRNYFALKEYYNTKQTLFNNTSLSYYFETIDNGGTITYNILLGLIFIFGVQGFNKNNFAHTDSSSSAEFNNVGHLFDKLLDLLDSMNDLYDDTKTAYEKAHQSSGGSSGGGCSSCSSCSSCGGGGAD
jgi:hypothetical protein